MSVVPPGNKQLGEFSVITTYSAASGVTQSNSKVVQGQLLVVQDNAPAPSPVHNLQLGESSTVLTYGAVDSVTNISTGVIQGLAVFKLEPQTIYKDYIIQGTLTVVDSEANTVEPSAIKPLQFGEQSTIITYGATPDLISLSCNQLEAFAVVQEFVPRNELTIFNIEYAADAEFNQSTN